MGRYWIKNSPLLISGLLLSVGIIGGQNLHAQDVFDRYIEVFTPHPQVKDVVESFPMTCIEKESTYKLGDLFGVACQAQGYGDVSRAEAFYPEFIVDQSLVVREKSKSSLNQSEHQNKYLTLVMAIVTDIAKHVIAVQSGFVSSSELTDDQKNESQFFVQAAIAKTIQESFLVHYRNRFAPIGKSHPLMITVGDLQKGIPKSFGISQIYEKYHDVPIDFRFDLVTNLAYGINYFGQHWQRAKSTGCVSEYKKYRNSKTNSEAYWTAVSRTAYAAYNGGGGAICRPFRKSHQNDKGYLRGLNQVKKGKYASLYNEQARRPINAVEFLKNGSDLYLRQDSAIEDYMQSRVIYLDDGRICNTTEADGKIVCVEESSVANCMSQQFNQDGHRFGLFKVEDLEHQIESVVDKDKVCKYQVDKLYSVGSIIRPLKNTYVRDENGQHLYRKDKDGEFIRSSSGEKIKLQVRGPQHADPQIYQVIDYQISSENQANRVERKYKIYVAHDDDFPQAGYIFAGKRTDKNVSHNDHINNWAVLETDINQIKNWDQIVVPIVGSRLVMQRRRPFVKKSEMFEGRSKVEKYADVGDEFEVKDVTVLGSNHQIYVGVLDQKDESIGFYAGRVGGNRPTSPYYIKILPPKEEQ